METKTRSLQIADDGTLTIPGDLIRSLRVAPRQTITVEARQDAIILAPSHKDRLEHIGHLLRTALADVEWSEIEAGRRDRCFSA